MKLLRKVKTNGWELKQKCTGINNGGGGCKSRLLMNEDGIFRTHCIHSVSPFEHYIYYFYTFKCPVCGVESDIPPSKVPLRIKLKIDKKRSKEKNTI